MKQFSNPVIAEIAQNLGEKKLDGQKKSGIAYFETPITLFQNT